MAPEQDSLREILQREFELRRKKNPSFSLRAFSKKLGIGSSALSELLSGKRRLSPQKSETLLAQIGLKPDQALPKHLVKHDQYELIANWLHFALLSYLQTGRKRDSKSMAQAFSVTESEVKSTLSRLSRLGLVENSHKEWVVCHKNVTSTDDIPSRALRESHFENLRLAEHALENLSVAERDFTSLTFCLQLEDFAELKKLLRQFYQRLETRFEKNTEGAEVFKMNAQIFPLTKPLKTEEK